MGTGSDSGKAVNQKTVPVIPLCYSYQFNLKDKCGAARNAWLRELAIAPSYLRSALCGNRSLALRYDL